MMFKYVNVWYIQTITYGSYLEGNKLSSHHEKQRKFIVSLLNKLRELEKLQTPKANWWKLMEKKHFKSNPL